MDLSCKIDGRSFLTFSHRHKNTEKKLVVVVVAVAFQPLSDRQMGCYGETVSTEFVRRKAATYSPQEV